MACAKGPPSGGAGIYVGVVANTKEIGLMEVTVGDSAKGPLPATGTVKFPSRIITLTGTLDKSKTQLLLSSSVGHTMVAESRPDYALGQYKNAQDEEDQGAFALLLQNTEIPVESFCGSHTNTSADEAFTHPLAVAASPGGQAICVGPNFTWLGSLGTDDVLRCVSSGGGMFEGNVNSTGNPWGTNDYTGTWAVTPCASDGANDDGGVSDGDAGDTAAPDAALDAAAPMDSDAPIQPGADAPVDDPVPAVDAGAQDAPVSATDAGAQD